LDIVCYKGQWNVILHFDDKGTINGILAYYLTKKYGQIIITNPPLTPHSGILVIETDVKSDSIKIIETLISKLPVTTYYTQSYEPGFTNWLPMYWKGYTQTTRITYVIDNVRDWNMKMCTDQMYRKIKKGATKFTIQY
jgi:hypothetical protein